ncbi:HAMP domain-containing sensor histidine kinase [Lysinibacter sp. HNR]|uniref:sensor histidine kinase n=1 Tax=Lysinibacter sp. HNR TaxID=3031408 RepID=UPI0024358F83|nr:HAMP domain-containing sensor histidine kinase [Lysinibacter sp. HNR]WGD37942.1 HAMP domain-containing sensor histidine kinase [Lysinibacter sp. HNR]
MKLSEKKPHYRLTVRARLALTYSILLSGAGIVMFSIIYVFVGVIPKYNFTPLTQTIETSPQGYPEADSIGATIEAQPSLISLDSQNDVLTLLLIVSIIALIVLGIAGAWVGWVVAGRMLRPLQYVSAAAQRASAGELNHRIGLSGPRDEISDLAHSFDSMMTVLERSIATYRRFSANASHELRTPLATSRTMIDVALLTASPEERPLLERLREMNERSIKTVEELLDLAEIDSAVQRMQPVDFSDLVRDVMNEAQDEIASHGLDAVLTVGDESPLIIQGNPVLLRQLINNLVQNSIHHNVQGGYIRVELTRDSIGSVLLSVSNSGQRITEEQARYLCDPFYRVSGRTNSDGHANRGLGLSLVLAITERHGGNLNIEPSPTGGLRVGVKFAS